MKLYTFALLITLINPTFSQNLLDKIEHRYADNKGVKIHYVTKGKGPLIVMLHGFPDYWYTWRYQIEVLSKKYKVVAVDLRGYNKSDKPKGVENYTMRYLVSDVAAVIKDAGYTEAIIIGHDWGGAIAWQVAMNIPQIVEKLIIISTPHPRGLFREINNNKEQQENSEYAREYQKENAPTDLTPERLAGWVKDNKAKPYYIEAFKNSDIEAMLNYYKASFPKQTKKKEISENNKPKIDKEKTIINCPTLAIFGKQDKALLPAGWNDTWNWIDNNFTLVSIPGAGHFVQQDASDFVTTIITHWLTMQ